MNEKRIQKEIDIRKKMIFISDLMDELQIDFAQGCCDQGQYGTMIENRTRYAADVRRIRRELLKLWKMLMGA